MLVGVIYGSYVHRHPARASRAATCAICGRETRFEYAIERAWHLFFVPLVPRGFRRLRQCTHCGQGYVDELPRADRPRRVLARYVVTTYALLAIALGLGLTVDEHADARTRARAADPQVGDLWTVDFAKAGVADPDDPSYGRLRVNQVDAHTVVAAACDLTSNRADAVEERCLDFPHAQPLERAMIALWMDHGAVRSIDRASDGTDPLVFASAGAALSTIAIGLLARWRSRRSFAGTSLPRATMVAGR